MPSLPSLPLLGIPSIPDIDEQSNPMFASALATARALDRLRSQQEYLSKFPSPASRNQQQQQQQQQNVTATASSTPNPPRSSARIMPTNSSSSTSYFSVSANLPQTSRQERNTGMNYKPFQFVSNNNNKNRSSSSTTGTKTTSTSYASSPQPARTPREEVADWISTINQSAKNHEKVNDGSRNPAMMMKRRK